MFEDILGIMRPKTLEREQFMGCPFCGKLNFEEDGPGHPFIQPMVCMTCGGQWTVEYDEELGVKQVSY